MGVTSPVSEILLLSKMANFPFRPMGYIVHGHQKIQLLRIGSKKIMQVGVDVTCINTNFGGRDLSGFGDIATFKNGHIVHGHQKIQLLRIGSKKSCK